MLGQPVRLQIGDWPPRLEWLEERLFATVPRPLILRQILQRGTWDDAYLVLSHLLAHLLFTPHAYHAIDDSKMLTLLGILEDVRVESLWRRGYPGTNFARLWEAELPLYEKAVSEHATPTNLLLLAAVGGSLPETASQVARWYFHECVSAVERVQVASFAAVLREATRLRLLAEALPWGVHPLLPNTPAVPQILRGRWCVLDCRLRVHTDIGMRAAAWYAEELRKAKLPRKLRGRVDRRGWGEEELELLEAWVEKWLQKHREMVEHAEVIEAWRLRYKLRRMEEGVPLEELVERMARMGIPTTLQPAPWDPVPFKASELLEVRSLRTIVKRILEWRRAAPDIVGDAVDIPEYIEYRILKRGDPMVFEGLPQPHSAIILILDVSASMHRYIERCRDLLAKLAKALEGEVYLKIYAFDALPPDTVSSGQIRIYQVERPEQLRSARPRRYTPLPMVIRYLAAYERLRCLTNRRFLILVSDFEPAMGVWSEGLLDALTRRAVKEARWAGWRIFGIVPKEKLRNALRYLPPHRVFAVTEENIGRVLRHLLIAMIMA